MKKSLTLERGKIQILNFSKCWVICIFLGIFFSNTYAQMLSGPAGVIDRIDYEEELQTLKIHGWVWRGKTPQSTATLNALLDGKTYEVGIETNVERPDVQAALGIPQLKTGFFVKISLNSKPRPGKYTFKVNINFPEEQPIHIALPDGDRLTFEKGKTPSRHWIMLALIISGVAAIQFFSFRRQNSRKNISARSIYWHFTSYIVLAFICLTALGITGSSWLLLTSKDAEFLEFEGTRAKIFKPKSIRGDEWMILTTNTLAQWNHSPKFPVINNNIGPEGQNMGVIGMTGVPIAQVAAFARPATWGYFFLPLRHAMAWHWMFPFFACLLALWGVLNIFRAHQEKFNLAISLLFCTAPYAMGWSLWPLYACFFPLALFATAATALRTNNKWKTFSLGIAGGMLLAGWVLVLYPPWQITTGTLMVLLTVGWLVDNRKSVYWNWPQGISLLITLSIAGLLIGSWWLDSYPAIEKIQATIYPGARSMETGGTLPWNWALRGYTNLETLTFGTASHHLTNESEISSYFYLPIPILIIAARKILNSRNSSKFYWTLVGGLVFCCFWTFFLIFGIPLLLAKATAWSRVSPLRLDLSMGLAFSIFLSLFYRKEIFSKPANNTSISINPHPASCILAAIGSFFLVLLIFYLTPKEVLHTHDWILPTAVALAIGAASWWLMIGKNAEALGMLLLLNNTATLGFNPWTLAPKRVSLTPESAIFAANPGRPGDYRPTMVISKSTRAPMLLAAAGVPVVNSVLYYPQSSFWKKINLPEEKWSLINRYQHFIIMIDPDHKESSYRVENPALDVVHLIINPSRFDFSSIGIERVAAEIDQAKLLEASGQLSKIGHSGGLAWYAIKSTSAL